MLVCFVASVEQSTTALSHTALCSSLIKCLIGYYLFLNNNWLCRIPQLVFPQLVGSSHTLPLEMLLGLPSCQQLIPAFPSVRCVTFCLESQKTTALRGFFFPSVWHGLYLNVNFWMSSGKWQTKLPCAICHKSSYIFFCALQNTIITLKPSERQ